jgi:hypothetical protein
MAEDGEVATVDGGLDAVAGSIASAMDEDEEGLLELGEAPAPPGQIVEDIGAELVSALDGDPDNGPGPDQDPGNHPDTNPDNRPDDDADRDPTEAEQLQETDAEQAEEVHDADVTQTQHLEDSQTAPGAEDRDLLEQKVGAVVETGQPPPVAEQEPLLAYVRRRGVDSILADDYEKARRYQITEEIVQRAIHEERMRSDTNSWIDSLDSRISGLRRRIDQINAEWDARLADSAGAFAERRDRMERRHSDERREFREQWRDAHVLCGFSKASPVLLQLRQVQRNQALSRDFEGALATKAIADRRQAAEEEESRARATRAMRAEWEHLRTRQEREAQLADEHRVRQRAYMDEMRAREIAGLQLAIQQIEGRKSGPRPKFVGPVVVRPKLQDDRPTSPATRRNLYEYRTAKEKQTRLRLPGVDVEQCVRPARAPAQPFKPRTTKRYRTCQ